MRRDRIRKAAQRPPHRYKALTAEQTTSGSYVEVSLLEIIAVIAQQPQLMRSDDPDKVDKITRLVNAWLRSQNGNNPFAGINLENLCSTVSRIGQLEKGSQQDAALKRCMDNLQRQHKLPDTFMIENPFPQEESEQPEISGKESSRPASIKHESPVSQRQRRAAYG